MNDEKLKPFAKDYVRAMCDMHFGRIKKVPYTLKIEAIEDSAKSAGITPAQLVTFVMQHQVEIQKELEAENADVPFVINNIKDGFLGKPDVS